jgi:hypothetical protein
VERYYQIVTLWNRREAAVRKLSYFWVPIAANLQRNTLAMLVQQGRCVLHRTQKRAFGKQFQRAAEPLSFAKSFF